MQTDAASKLVASLGHYERSKSHHARHSSAGALQIHQLPLLKVSTSSFVEYKLYHSFTV